MLTFAQLQLLHVSNSKVEMPSNGWPQLFISILYHPCLNGMQFLYITHISITSNTQIARKAKDLPPPWATYRLAHVDTVYMSAFMADCRYDPQTGPSSIQRHIFLFCWLYPKAGHSSVFRPNGINRMPPFLIVM